MKHLKVMLLTAVAVCAFGAVAAQAAPPEFSSEFANEFAAKSTTPSFEGAKGNLKVKCASSEGTGSLTGAKSGKFDELFLSCECTLFGIGVGKATGLPDTITGSILATGTSTLGFRLGTLVPLAALTISPVHFTCGGELTIVRGCLLGTTTLTKSKTGTLTFTGTGAKQSDTDYTSDAKTTVACKLESSFAGGAFEASDQVQTATLTFAKQVEVVD